MKTGSYKIFSRRSAAFAVRWFFISCLLPTVYSQTPTEPPIQTAKNFHRWGAVTLFNGLPSDSVRAIAQTPDGVLWFGTDNGLARFDGRRVSAVALDADAGANKILALAADENGTLWVGTNGGAFRYENGGFQKIEATKNYAVTAILFDESVFFATENGAVLKISEGSENAFRVEKIPIENLSGSDGQPLKITSLAKIGDRIVAGTRSRSILLVENNQTFETFSRPRPFFVNALVQDRRGRVWLGADAEKTGSGFFAVRDPRNLRRIGERIGNVLAIEPDASGAWVGSEDDGLFHFSGERELEHFTFENTAGGLRSNTVYAVFTDREGVLWIGTNRGVSRFDASSPFNRTVSESGNGNFVRTLYRAASERIFAGTNRGLFEFAGGNWRQAENFPSKTVYAMGENSAEQFLIAAPNGLFDFDGQLKLAGDARAVAPFRAATYAAIFGRGVIEIETGRQIFANGSPSALFADANEKLWIGTLRDGVFLFDGTQTKPENALDALRGWAIRKIVKGAGRDLWIAGERGLFRFSGGELRNVIAGEDVRDVCVTDADVFAATLGKGLIHVRFDDEFGWLYSNLNVEQGLPSEQIFALLPIENRLLIGTNRGVVDYAPSAVAPQIVASRVLSQRLHSADELTKTINLDYPQNSLLVEVAGLSSRTFPEQFQYAFTLKNAAGATLDKKISTDAQFAPANLPAGAYRIEARAFNKDLLGSAPLVIDFSVARAPFPRTATALGVLLTIASIGLIWGSVERRRIKQKNRELARARFDLANEAERERRRIAQDLHDQTLADLRQLMLMSDKLPLDTGEFRREIESVSTEIRRICEDLSPSVLENVGLAPALEFLLQHTTTNYRFSAAEDLEEKFNFPPNQQMQLYRIAQEVLNNIKRHSSAESVEMKIEISAENRFVISISDDGAPFNPAENTAQTGRGIANIKARAALIDAEVDWTKSENGANVFRLKK